MILPRDSCNNLELEIARTSSGVRMYINAYSIPFPFDPLDDTRTQLTLILGDTSAKIYAERMQGGQKLLLGPENADAVIEAFMDNQCVHVAVGRYNEDFVPTRFTELYFKLMDLPIAYELK